MENVKTHPKPISIKIKAAVTRDLATQFICLMLWRISGF